MLDLSLWFPEGIDGPWTNIRQAAVAAALAETYQVEQHQADPAAAKSQLSKEDSEETEDAWAEAEDAFVAQPDTQELAERPEAVTRPASVEEAMRPRSRPQRSQQRSQLDLARVLPRQAAMHMTHALAARWLKSSGLRTKSSGHCTSRHMHHCTSLDSVRAGTIARIIDLKHDSGCPVMVTGGTEAGHAPGQYSHGNGYKLDITHNACIDRYITRHHRKAGVRGDGAALYRSATGTVFANESSHWDILFR
ncbi:hypothetical protein [Nonomuraea sp. NPDC001023]|uniref:hypothetical protein n=1 Tax=unclassified Nonomuraea TaxID=2593643 RepID=UPI0033206C14